MADKPPVLPPASEPFPGSRTPGWNDPPTLQYNPLAPTTSNNRTRLNLNKRVAFPLQGATAKPTAIVPPNQSSLPPIMSLPPTVAGTTQPIAVVHPMPNVGTIPLRNYTYTDVIYVLRILREQILAIVETAEVSREEILRRINPIEQLWQSMSAPVQERLYRISEAIRDNNYNESMKAYMTLVTHNANECANWSMALKHIILTLQPANNEQEPSALHIQSMFVPGVPQLDVNSDILRETNAQNIASQTNITHSDIQHI
ncbi:steroid receptor RNA activator 1-like [Teleopsis dalmanni]|uniref:steroid receptor RNA activator 1-like n=1 Tax=Teleopsis dalmanni TaxID=139649 RepID=UPI0018CEBDAB|nr:steroid receptor RNA activator 1-like [Teleopsis dalmanni]XP_037937533.1 steroid receptor RNA activator 1-like [Teleopsis dalmanni]